GTFRFRSRRCSRTRPFPRRNGSRKRRGASSVRGADTVPTEVIMPALGMAQETGKLLRWIKNEGEAVTKGEALMEIETDKVTVEIEAPADGILAGISALEGEDVPVGRAIAF